MSLTKTYHIEVLGCAKNQVDAEELMAQLNVRGLLHTAPDEADCIIVQTCGFIESAKKESLDAVFTLRAQYPQKKIMVTGCLARRYQAELRETLTESDAVLGESSHSRLADIISERTDTAEEPLPGERPLLSPAAQAYIKIAEGCDNHCSFCAIPMIRGPLQSRTYADIVPEFTGLIRRGIREICLIAQDTAAYGRDRAGKSLLAGLLAELLKTKDDFWIRLLYLHPDHFPQEIVPLMRADNRLVPYMDIPFQHAAPKVLARMGRAGSAERYLELIQTIRSEIPHLVLRSTFLTGFPGETEADFETLLRFQKEAELDWAGVFTYSREEGTPAYAMQGLPSKREALRRKKKLEEAQSAISAARLERFVGKPLDVLVEEAIDEESGLYLGRGYLHAPEVDGAAVIETRQKLERGSVVRVTVTGRAGLDLRCVV